MSFPAEVKVLSHGIICAGKPTSRENTNMSPVMSLPWAMLQGDMSAFQGICSPPSTTPYPAHPAAPLWLA